MAGALNYNQHDSDDLLDSVEGIEPCRSNQWSLVATEFQEWAAESGRPLRDMDSLKATFDKLVNVKKPTGNLSCPDDVRRAKSIARDILQNLSACTIGY